MEDRTDQEIDLGTLWGGIWRRMGWIVGISVLAAVAVFLWSRTQAPVYESSAALLASNTQGQDGLLGTAVIKSPPLPEGAVGQALQSTAVMGSLIQAVQADSSFSPTQRALLTNHLTKELGEQRLATIRLSSQLDLNGNGIYTITAQAGSAKAAQRLADLASTGIRNWDAGRALQNIVKAQAGFQAQLAQIDRRLQGSALTAVERQTLITRRVTIQDNLAQVTILQNSAVGVLTLLSSAVEPLTSVAPKPTRNALLTALLVLLIGMGIAALLTVTDRTVRSEDDLLTLNMVTLGILPRLKKRDIVFSGIIRAARQAGLYEAIGFLRVNLMTLSQSQPHPVLMIASTVPGEGKSSLTATLADGFASSGRRVLIIDADLRRGTQSAVWEKFSKQGEWQQLSGQGGARTAREAFRDPLNVQVLRVEENVDVLPAGPNVQDSLTIWNQADIGTALQLWRQQYDIVLVDSAPLLALPDGLVVGVYVDGVLMVVEHGKTSTKAIKVAIRRADRAGLKLLGFVINKAEGQRETGYSYSYSPRKALESV